MSKEHWVLLGAALGVAGVQVATLAHWHEAMTPAFIGGILVQMGILLRAIHTEKPS